jgi:hypothetical protein
MAPAVTGRLTVLVSTVRGVETDAPSLLAR